MEDVCSYICIYFFSLNEIYMFYKCEYSYCTFPSVIYATRRHEWMTAFSKKFYNVSYCIPWSTITHQSFALSQLHSFLCAAVLATIAQLVVSNILIFCIRTDPCEIISYIILSVDIIWHNATRQPQSIINVLINQRIIVSGEQLDLSHGIRLWVVCYHVFAC